MLSKPVSYPSLFIHDHTSFAFQSFNSFQPQGILLFIFNLWEHSTLLTFPRPSYQCGQSTVCTTLSAPGNIICVFSWQGSFHRLRLVQVCAHMSKHFLKLNFQTDINSHRYCGYEWEYLHVHQFYFSSIYIIVYTEVNYKFIGFVLSFVFLIRWAKSHRVSMFIF